MPELVSKETSNKALQISPSKPGDSTNPYLSKYHKSNNFSVRNLISQEKSRIKLAEPEPTPKNDIQNKNTQDRTIQLKRKSFRYIITP